MHEEKTMSETISRRETREIWFNRIEYWRKSGLSQAEYCRQHNLKPSNFYNWSIKYRDRQIDGSNILNEDKTLNPDFIPVTIQSVTNEFTLSYGDISLHFSSGLTPESLVPWIKALRAGAC
jgi:hypothetical protein